MTASRRRRCPTSEACNQSKWWWSEANRSQSFGSKLQFRRIRFSFRLKIQRHHHDTALGCTSSRKKARKFSDRGNTTLKLTSARFFSLNNEILPSFGVRILPPTDYCAEWSTADDLNVARAKELPVAFEKVSRHGLQMLQIRNSRLFSLYSLNRSRNTVARLVRCFHAWK